MRIPVSYDVPITQWKLACSVTQIRRAARAQTVARKNLTGCREDLLRLRQGPLHERQCMIDYWWMVGTVDIPFGKRDVQDRSGMH